MSWSTFGTYLLQALIVLVVLFIVSAAVSAVWDGIRKNHR